jgi:N-acetylmuramoyl-L-alanine amidase
VNPYKNIAIVVGHDNLSRGAYSPFLDFTEYEYNTKVGRRLKEMGYDVFKHQPNISYRQKMKTSYRRLNGYDLTIELHFNSFHNNLAHGCECLYFHTNKKGKELAAHFSEYISKAYYTRNRGPKALSNPNQRGYWAVASGIPTALLIEPFFGSNPEANKFLDPTEYANTLAEAIQLI